MRIAIDASNLSSGGGITHLENFLNNIDYNQKKFKKIYIWSSKNTLERIPDKHWLKKYNPNILNKNIIFRSFWQIFLSNREFRRAKIDILFVPGGNYIGSFRPYITMFRNLLPFSPQIISLYKSFTKRFKFKLLRISQLRTFRSSQGLIFLTDFAENHISKEIDLKKLRTIKIPHGINSNSLENNLRKDIKKSSGLFRLVYVSQFDVYKNQTFVLKALNEFCKKHKDIDIEINFVGKKDNQEYIIFKKNIKSHKNLKIIVNGIADNKNLNEILSNSDIAIFASNCENLPNTLIEYMSKGLPIISSSFGPMPEILRDAGLYFDLTNINSFIEKLELMVFDPTIRLNLAEKALNYAKEYSWSKCSIDTINFITKIKKDFEQI